MQRNIRAKNGSLKDLMRTNIFFGEKALPFLRGFGQIKSVARRGFGARLLESGFNRSSIFLMLKSFTTHKKYGAAGL